MFCHKCGTRAPDDAEFCHNCGTRLIVDRQPPRQEFPQQTPTQQTPPQQISVPQEAPQQEPSRQTAMPQEPPQQDFPQQTPQQQGTSRQETPPAQGPAWQGQPPQIPPTQTLPQQIPPQVPPCPVPPAGKKSKLPVILGAAAAVVVIVVVLGLFLGRGGGAVDALRAYTPYADSQGLPYSCGEVLDACLSGAKWRSRSADGASFVEISGALSGTRRQAVVSVPVEDGHADLGSVSVTVDGVEQAGDPFFAFFVAYDGKDKDMTQFDALLEELSFALGGEGRMEVFTHEASGLSFRYPACWVVQDSASEYQVAELISPRNSDVHAAVFQVRDTLGMDTFEAWSGDEDLVRKAVSEAGTFVQYGDAQLGGVTAKAVKYLREGIRGEETVIGFWYYSCGSLYEAECVYTTSAEALYGPAFTALMASFEVDPPSPYPLASSSQAQALFEAWLADHPVDFNCTLNAWDDDAGEDCFYFDVLSDGSAVLLLSVRKSDGYMEFVYQYDTVSVDEWYENVYGFGSGPQSVSYYMVGDDYCFISFYSDGTFYMEVNLYEGIGSIFGSYEDWGASVDCWVESRDFSGFVGDDVSHFEMLWDGTQLVYSGRDIGTCRDGSVFV